MTALKEALWRKDRRRVFLSKAQYLSALDGWDLEAHEVGGEVVGVAMSKGPEFHYATFGPKWHLNRADIRKYLSPILAQHGRVVTRAPRDDYRQQRFNRIIGFTDVGGDEFFIHMELKALKLGRQGRNECQ